MGRTSRRFTAAVSSLLLVVGLAGSAGASSGLAEGVPPSLTEPTGAPPAVAHGPVTVFVELRTRPAIEAFATESDGVLGRRAAEQARSSTGAAADAVIGALRSHDAGARELYRTANAVPGVVVTGKAAAVRELSALPGVAGIHPVTPKKQAGIATAQLSHAVEEWRHHGGLGDNVRVGVIDDGIDYTHADFGGPGTPEAYRAINHSTVDPAYFPTAKVVGGTDLAGDDYDATGANGSATPNPDPNPIACGDHGTHVAGVTAGFGVTADGATFRGDYAGLTASTVNAMRIPPGTASHALLYAIKVFGCRGTTSLTGQALDWALDPNGDGDFSDHLDVVTVTPETDFGAPDDPDSLFVRKLTAHGVLVVAPAGDGGDRYDAGGSPGSTPEALTVASTSLPDRAGASTVSPFSARGVRAPSVKPDVAAPGEAVPSALRGSGNQPFALSGTAVAAAHVAGVAALVRQAHRDWTPGEVKAAVLNTADPRVLSTSGSPAAPQRGGSGRVDAAAAVDNQVLATVQDNVDVASVSFGPVEVAEPVRRTKTVRLVNKGERPAAFSVSYREITRTPGVRYTLSAGSVWLAPHGTATVDITLVIDDPRALRKTVDPSVVTIQNGQARQFVADASGRLVFLPFGDGAALAVPVYAAPRPVAVITNPDRIRFSGADTHARLPLRGKGLDQGSGSRAYRSLVSAMELQASRPQLPPCGPDLITRCTVNDTAKGANLRYVGVASTAPLANQQGRPDQALLAFGLVTWGNWYNLGDNLIPFVDIFTENGAKHYEIFLQKAADTDVWLATTVLLNDPNHGAVDVQPVNGQFGDVDTGVFDTNVIMLPVRLTALGIDPTKESYRITYSVGFIGYYPPPGDEWGWMDYVLEPMSFDVLRPGLWVRGDGEPALSYRDQPGTALVVNRDSQALATDKALGLLLLHHHDGTGARASVVTVDQR